MIDIQGVTKLYRKAEAPALEDVSLTIQDGEFVFIVGDSGAGKSTLIKLLLGETRPSSGSIQVDDREISRLPFFRLPKYRRSFGVIFQDFRLIGDMDVYENVAFAQRVIGASPKAIERRVPRILEQVGLSDKAGSRPDQLSGGEQQRAAIARALINGPKYLLADEPTGNLDPDNSREVMNQLERVNRAGTTVIVVTHDKAMVDEMQKRVITFKNGRLIHDVAQGGYEYVDS